MGASATTWYVDGARGSNGYSGQSPVWPKRTIQSAIDASSRGDYVLIAGGVYAENLRLSKCITLHGYEPQTVKIDGRHAGHCLSINDGAAFFAATTEDGFWTEECEAEAVGETLFLTFEDAAPIVIRCVGGGNAGRELQKDVSNMSVDTDVRHPVVQSETASPGRLQFR